MTANDIAPMDTSVGQHASAEDENEREFFDPMTGRFRTNPFMPYQSFFTPKLRWRGDLELAEFAHYNEKTEKHQLAGCQHSYVHHHYDQHYYSYEALHNNNNQPSIINMLMTEQQPQSTSIVPNSTGELFQQQQAVAGSTLDNGGGDGESSSAAAQRRGVDPSLMDYEVIDVYWRRDIEQEKNGFFSSSTMLHPVHQNSNNNNNNNNQRGGGYDAVAEQFEHDLQLLTEKSLFVTLSNNERYRYENLSKAHYSDFYRQLGGGCSDSSAGKENASPFSRTALSSSAAAARYPSTVAQNSQSTTTAVQSEEMPFEGKMMAPTTSTSVLNNDVTDTANEEADFPKYEDEKPEDFFQHLAKECAADFELLQPLSSLENNNDNYAGSVSSLATMNSCALVGNGGRCATIGDPESLQPPILMQNVSLADAANVVQDTTGNVTDFFQFDLSTMPLEEFGNLMNGNHTYTAQQMFAASNSTYGNLLDDTPVTMDNHRDRSISIRSATNGNNNVEFPSPSALNEGDIYYRNVDFPNLSGNSDHVHREAMTGGGRSRYHSLRSTTTIDQRTTPTSGIDSLYGSSSSSPRNVDDNTASGFYLQNNGQFGGDLDGEMEQPHTSRFYNKLAPSVASAYADDDDDEEETDDFEEVDDAEDFVLKSRQMKILATQQKAPRRRGRQSKDEQLASEHRLPATAEAITRMSHQEVQRILRDQTLTATQKALVKKIRRRGRNKVAARKCRERRIHPSGPSANSLSTQKIEENRRFNMMEATSSHHYHQYEDDGGYFGGEESGCYADYESSGYVVDEYGYQRVIVADTNHNRQSFLQNQQASSSFSSQLPQQKRSMGYGNGGHVYQIRR